MKLIKKSTALFMALIMTFNFSVFGIFQAYAHDAMLDVTYDDCMDEQISDGIDEMWYALNTS
ncbi:MAG: hypothetical protein IJW92_09400, partial [Clostridia bacterium]|nr:hypothetical protein [Clostridia bacterium]